MGRQEDLTLIDEIENYLAPVQPETSAATFLDAARTFAGMAEDTAPAIIKFAEDKTIQSFEQFLLKLSNLEALGLNNFIHGLTAGPSRTAQEERRITEERRKSLHSVISNASFSQTLQKIDNNLAGIAGDRLKLNAMLRQQEKQSFQNIHAHFERMEKAYEEAYKDPCDKKIDAISEIQQQTLDEVNNLQEILERGNKMTNDLRERAALELKILKETSANIEDRPARGIVRKLLDAVEEKQKLDPRGPHYESKLKRIGETIEKHKAEWKDRLEYLKTHDPEQYERLAALQKTAEGYTKITGDLQKDLQEHEFKRQELQKIKEKIEALQAELQDVKNKFTPEQIEERRQAIRKNQQDMNQIKQDVKDLQESIERRSYQRTQSTIDIFNHAAKNSEGTWSNYLADKVGYNKIGEDANGHEVYYAPNTKLFYSLDENNKRVYHNLDQQLEYAEKWNKEINHAIKNYKSFAQQLDEKEGAPKTDLTGTFQSSAAEPAKPQPAAPALDHNIPMS